MTRDELMERMNGEEFMQRFVLATQPTDPAEPTEPTEQEPDDIMTQIERVRRQCLQR